jgi:hypothetical protein
MARSLFNDEFPLAQLGLTVVIALSSFLFLLLISFLIAIPVFGIRLADFASLENLTDPKNIAILKYFQIVQSVSLFVLPPFILGKIFSGNTFRYLRIDVSPQRAQAMVVLLIMVTAIPLINYLATLNSMIKLPEFMSSVEQFMMKKEEDAKILTDAFMKVSDIQGLVINLMMIGVIAAIGEELLFRGVLQRIFSNWTRSYHWGIVISAFIFSALHMQFYGFFPRWFLGIMFGYMLVWSGSLWLPIFAHFVNNSVAVITYFLINKGVVNEKMADIGSTTEILPYTIVFSIVMFAGIYFLYKKRISYNA